MKRLQHLIFLFAFSLLCSGAFAQAQSSLDMALRHIEGKQAEWGVTKTDISDLTIASQVFSKFGEIDHFYFNQRHNGINVYNAITSVHISPDGAIYSPRHNFISDLGSKINTTASGITEVQALKSVMTDLELPVVGYKFTPKQKSQGVTTFDKGNISNVDIKVKPIYQVVSENEVRLAWDVTLDPANNPDYWNIRVDATSGQVLDKTNFTIYCTFAGDKTHTHSAGCTDHNHDAPIMKTESGQASSAIMGGSYNVFAEVIDGLLYPHESPVHGDRNLITDPADPTASPFGWHDVDGEDGPEFTITRGNNVFAFLDTDDNDSPDANANVDGGEELIFDFPWSDDLDPENSDEASVSNLFFMSNYIHDFAFAYGFDESAGNFQQTNYSGEGSGNDPVSAQAQDGREIHYADILMEADHINNANFATPSEGGAPRMQMYVWNRVGGRLIEVKSPEGIAGRLSTGTAAFGPAATDQPVSDAEVALARDGNVQNPTFTCDDAVNPDELAGKIALIDRGGCFFMDKALNAEDAGAIAAVICNFEDTPMGMATPTNPPPTRFPTIPTVSLSSSDCNLIKSVINSGETVVMSIGEGGNEGADFFDGDYDNGIIAHEYGHGISNRLVGGPANTGCLNNAEQMGEGWSDFYGLVTTVKPGDVGNGRNGIGNYVSREAPNGNGIRSNPYSTDMSIDPETYGDLPTQAVPHGLGAVWNSMLWDLYWDLVDEYGFDDDIMNGEGGNNIAVRLVTEGLKLTSCSPGFVDGRDGILAADQLLYKGANNCLIWKTFARRGLGMNASQGSTADATDGTEDFNPPPGCVKEVKLSKRLASPDRFADVVDPGGSLAIEITIRNDKDEVATQVVVSESIPAGATITDITGDGQVSGDNIVWEIDTLATGQEMVFTYTLNTDPDVRSETLFIDDLESGPINWVNISDSAEDPDLTANPFTITGDSQLGVYGGNNAYFIENIAVESRENLLLFEGIDVQGTNPGIRFFQNYDTELAADGVLVQVSRDGELWEDIDDDLFIKNGYPSPIAFQTFTLPFLSAFTGNSNGWIDTWIDLSPYQGEIILLRMRFGSDVNNLSNEAAVGWAMDDFEVMDMVMFNTTATLTTAEGDLLEAILPNRGIKINSSGLVAVDDPTNPSLEFNIYPNPASDMVNIAINNITAKNAQLAVYNYGGQLIEQRVIDLTAGSQLQEVNVGNYPTGFYFFQLTTDRGVATEKVMVGK